MVTRKNRGKRIIVPCTDNTEGLSLDENDEEQEVDEETTGELNIMQVKTLTYHDVCLHMECKRA